MKKLFAMACLLLTIAACQEKLEDRAARDARETTAKRCPVRMSEDIVLERIDFDKATLTWKQSHLIDIDTTVVLVEPDVRRVLLQELKMQASTSDTSIAACQAHVTPSSTSHSRSLTIVKADSRRLSQMVAPFIQTQPPFFQKQAPFSRAEPAFVFMQDDLPRHLHS